MHKDALLNTKFPIFMSNLIYAILFETISYLYLKLITILIKIFLHNKYIYFFYKTVYNL